MQCNYQHLRHNVTLYQSFCILVASLLCHSNSNIYSKNPAVNTIQEVQFWNTNLILKHSGRGGEGGGGGTPGTQLHSLHTIYFSKILGK